MSDCPLCEWRYDSSAACIGAYPVGSRMAPIVWDGERLRVASGSEAPNGRHAATGIHMCQEHPSDPRVIDVGPWEEYAPLAELNALLGSYRTSNARSFSWLLALLVLVATAQVAVAVVRLTAF